MARAPFQVLVFPYRKATSGNTKYAIFSRSDYPCWQGIAGGGEDSEIPLEAAKRESVEEANIPSDYSFLQLDIINSIPVTHFKDSHLWGDDTYVIPEYTFGVAVGELNIQLSFGHNEFRWVSYAEAVEMLAYEGNKTALWELNQRILRKGPRNYTTG